MGKSFGAILLLSAAMIFATGTSVSAADAVQTCSGTLVKDEDGLLLEPDGKASSAWCSAYIGEDGNSPEALRVLKTCKIGGRCLIAGSYAGHGIFYWSRIDRIEAVNP